MKKKFLLMSCMIILGTTAFAADFTPSNQSLNFKVGLTDGTIDAGELDSSLDDQSTSANISANIEFIASSDSGLEYGAGLGFTKLESNESIELKIYTGDIDCYSLYALARYKFDTDSKLKPYVFGNFGYSYIDEEFSDFGDTIEINGGLYYAAGVGVEFNENFSTEFYWSRTDFEADIDGDETYDLDANMFTLAFGYKMDI